MVLPNQLTVLRIILTPVFFFLFLSGEPVLIQISAAVYIIAAITDWYDGWLARKFNYITEWGKFLDPLADKILTSAAFLALVIVGILELWMVLLIIFRDILITGLRVWADYKKISFSTSKSAKWKTFFQMTFQYYLLLIYTLKSIEPLNREYARLFEILFDKDFIYYTMLAITIFTVYTGITYFISNWSLIKKIIDNKN
ncbi:CDP-diacylglycerol--glycerol-3-phosphate 3-phosphatidyltransferase [Melioribacter sp. Ez-97]|uniref:CDP-diacylglycerol--glycerol-3-phosphate 3-phosphatidyltransferase n=1 Tax=Melioribacter sp. Ez-97 TaxID=3423434 RepID=UPI003EDACD87